MTVPDAAVVTAIYGAYDTLKPVMPQTGLDVDWVLVTDDASLRGQALGWRVVHLPRPGVHPNRAAKRPKLFPWEFTDAPSSVWVDAAYQVLSPDFVAGALACADPVAQFVHPWRDCAFDEASVSARMPRYVGEDFAAQVTQLREVHHHPEHWGLWAAGVIARQHTGRVRELSEDWQELIDAGTFQDQVSQPVALRFNGLRPSPFPNDYRCNDWLQHYDHLEDEA